jgi:hypothetical protein
MTDRTEAYARQFEEHSRRFISEIEGYSPAQMQARCEGEQCTVAALASHIAGVHTLVADWIKAAGGGGPLPKVTMDDVHAANAEQFARDAIRPKEEILADLRANGAAAAGTIRTLDDANLDQSHYFALVNSDVTTEWLVRDILIGDIASHSASIRAATEQTAAV